MSAANIAYLAVVLAAYAVFMFVLGAHWVRSALEDPAPRPRKPAGRLAGSAGAEAPAPRRRAA